MGKHRRVAIVHDWILALRGGERVLEALCRLYPDATVYTLFHRPGRTSPSIDGRKIVASILNRIPSNNGFYRYLLPLCPWAIGRFRLQDYDLVISCSHAVAKGARVPLPAAHLCYCLTPMRYIWDMFVDYQEAGLSPRRDRLGLRLFRRALQDWDRRTAQDVRSFAAISSFVAERIRRCYERESEVIYPPVRTDFFQPSSETIRREDYFLLVSALVPYKRVDLIIDAFNRLNVPLWIAGSGPLERRLRKKAGPGIRFLGYVGDEELRRLYQHARALVFAAREEFGLAPVEAQACGTPVIGFRDGGLGETIVHEQTGLLYDRQETEALIEAVERFPSLAFDPAALRKNALRFSHERFAERFTSFVARNTTA